MITSIINHILLRGAQVLEARPRRMLTGTSAHGHQDTDKPHLHIQVDKIVLRPGYLPGVHFPWHPLQAWPPRI